MIRIVIGLIGVVFIGGCAAQTQSQAELTNDGLIRKRSDFDVDTTVTRLSRILRNRGLILFEVVDHAAGAQKVNQSLRPTVVVIFGNPKAGTPLMQCDQEIGIDLPQKALIYQDQSDRVWLVYNDPAYLQARHKVSGCEQPLANVSKALAALSDAAVKRQ
ncbi:MAG: DUF302 domain-containing protein [Pseudomonadota bacterium]